MSMRSQGYISMHGMISMHLTLECELWAWLSAFTLANIEIDPIWSYFGTTRISIGVDIVPFFTLDIVAGLGAEL